VKVQMVSVGNGIGCFCSLFRIRSRRSRWETSGMKRFMNACRMDRGLIDRAWGLRGLELRMLCRRVLRVASVAGLALRCDETGIDNLHLQKLLFQSLIASEY